MIYRTTTRGNLRSYSYNLQRSMYNLSKTQNTVITGRNFNSYKEDTAAASRSFQLRSNLSQTSSQLTVSDSMVSKYEVAWSTLDTVVGDLNTAKTALLRASNDPDGSGRMALGQELEQIAESLVQYMNSTYGSNFVFAGTDGLNSPLELSENGALTYRGIDVNTSVPEITGTGEVGADGGAGSGYYALTDGGTILMAEYNRLSSNAATLEFLATGDTKYIDLGMGLDEGNLNSTSFDSSLSAIYYLGYGTDAEGDSQNIVSIIHELSQILQRCDADSGDWAEDATDRADFDRLFGKFEDAMATLTNRYTELDATASYLKSNHSMLEDRVYTLKEQISNLEDVDEAEAIVAYEWAEYCYNAALQVGNSVLSNSLMDYLSFN